MLWEKLARQGPIAVLTSVHRSDDRRAAVGPAAARWRSRRRVPSPRPTGARTTFDEQWAIIESLPDWATSSTARDVSAGRPSELDAIGGAVVRAGRRLGVPTPTLEELLAEHDAQRDRPHRARAPAPSACRTRTSVRSPAIRCSPTRSRRRSSRASSSASSAPPTPRRSRRSRAGTAPTCRSCARPSSRRRPRPTSSGSRTRSTGCRSATTSSRSSVRRIRSAARTSCGAASSSCSRRPKPTRIRAVELVKQHPGKMWVLDEDGRTMRPLLDQSDLDVAWHAGQYQALPHVYVQNSALEIAWTRVVTETGTREGRVARAVPHGGPRGLQRRRRGGLGARGGARRLG